jgi:outer membrane protein TolC
MVDQQHLLRAALAAALLAACQVGPDYHEPPTGLPPGFGELGLAGEGQTSTTPRHRSRSGGARRRSHADSLISAPCAEPRPAPRPGPGARARAARRRCVRAVPRRERHCRRDAHRPEPERRGYRTASRATCSRPASDASWELDLFGRAAGSGRRRGARRHEDRRDVLVSLLAEVARSCRAARLPAPEHHRARNLAAQMRP